MNISEQIENEINLTEGSYNLQNLEGIVENVAVSFAIWFTNHSLESEYVNRSFEDNFKIFKAEFEAGIDSK